MINYNKYYKILHEESQKFEPETMSIVRDNFEKINLPNRLKVEPGTSGSFINSKEATTGVNKDFSNFPANAGFSSVKKGEVIKIGGDNVIITDPYGIRGFKGQEGHHSTGIDYVTSAGKAIALKDGTITDVKLQGDGKIYNPASGKKEAGYYVVVKHTDGSYGQYMHLDPMTVEEMESLKNKPLKRGDSIWGYKKGSGTMTGTPEKPGVHVKFRIYGDDPKINIDPSQAVKGENYSFIPNRFGENILKQKL